MQGNPRGNGGAEEERVGECVGEIHSKVNYRSRDNRVSGSASFPRKIYFTNLVSLHAHFPILFNH